MNKMKKIALEEEIKYHEIVNRRVMISSKARIALVNLKYEEA